MFCRWPKEGGFSVYVRLVCQVPSKRKFSTQIKLSLVKIVRKHQLAALVIHSVELVLNNTSSPFLSGIIPICYYTSALKPVNDHNSVLTFHQHSIFSPRHEAMSSSKSLKDSEYDHKKVANQSILRLEVDLTSNWADIFKKTASLDDMLQLIVRRTSWFI